MRSTYRALAGLIAIGVVLQAAFIAFGTFDLLDVADTAGSYDGDENTGQALHSMGSVVVALLGLVLLIVSFFARIPGGVKWAAGVFGLIVLQWALAFVAFEAPVVGLLHAINAFVLAGAAGRAAALTRGPAPPAGQPPTRTTASA